MKKQLTIVEKKEQFSLLYFTGQYSQKELTTKLNISVVTANKWAKTLQPHCYMKAKIILSKQLSILLDNPIGNENLIFSYIEHLNLVENMLKIEAVNKKLKL